MNKAFELNLERPPPPPYHLPETEYLPVPLWIELMFDPGSKRAVAGRADVPQFHFERPPPRQIRRPHLPPGRSVPVYDAALLEYGNYPRIRNIIATAWWNPVPDLARIAHYLPNLELIADHASAIMIRIDRLMCRFYATGVMVLAVAKSIMHAKYEAHQCRLLLERIPLPVLLFDKTRPAEPPVWELMTFERISRFDDFLTQNIVASGRSSVTPLDLPAIISHFNTKTRHVTVHWQPELFPAAKLVINPSIACPLRRKVTMNLFDTGRNMAMGKHHDDIKRAQAYIRSVVAPFTDPNLPKNPLNRFAYRIGKMLEVSALGAGATVDQTQQALLDALDVEEEIVESGQIPVAPGFMADLETLAAAATYSNAPPADPREAMEEMAIDQAFVAGFFQDETAKFTR